MATCGKDSTYRLGCRCELCTKAHAEYAKLTRERRAGTPMKHGSVSTYQNLGCRCDDCRKAAASYFRVYRTKRSEAQS